MNDHSLNDIMERLRTRFYGKYRGVVTEVDASTMRLKASVPSVLPNGGTGWCMPCVPYAGDQVGFAFLPEVGAGVWIEFEGGETSYPIWTGCYWHSGEQPSDATATVKVIVTKSGHKLLLDDGSKTITITDAANNTITLASDGITLKRGSSSINLSDSEVNVNDGALEVV